MYGYGRSPMHLDAPLVVANRATRRDPRTSRWRPGDDEDEPRRTPSASQYRFFVLTTPTREVGDRVVRSRTIPSSPTGQPARVRLDDDVPGLRERERHHRERDPGDAEAHGAEHERDGDRDHREKRERGRQAPTPTSVSAIAGT